MNVITIPTVTIAASTPSGSRIAAADLADYYEADAIVTEARRIAQTLRDEAQQRLDEAQQQCESIRQNARDKGMQLLKLEAPLQRRRLVADVVHWLVEEQRLEQTLINRLEKQLRDMLVSVFYEFIADQNLTTLLAQRLKTRLAQVGQEQTATLRVCPQQYDELVTAFTEYPWLRVKNDAMLMAGEAQLDAPLFTVNINLDEQLQAILARLSPPTDAS
ncbi:hypothetical protein OB934_21575 [Aeromonas salmonicida]|uniref:hypothetical protein n=1 Tax=Aeromonas salmonicida TaxID=645 RepID=UPI00259DF53B|nr:hypothetical protein [Aeromonas salmonicida]MDM5065364.1 hypothetical protein [Aeromonas salmonicida]